MNYKHSIFAAIIATTLFGACSNDDHDGPNNEPSKYITVSTQIQGMTRVSNTDDGQQFDEGDQISVFAWIGDSTVAPVVGNRIVDNSINTLTGGKWIPNPQMLWRNPTDPHFFIGIYPSQETSAVADLTTVPYTLDVNNEMKSDMLVAVNNKGIKSTYDPVPLAFDHVMSKLVINLQYRNQWGGTPTVEKLIVKDAATKATVNCLTKITTASADGKADITVPVVNANEKYSSIMIPQTGVRSITLTIGGKDYKFTNTEDIKLEEGKISTVSLIVGRDSITLGNISTNDWATGMDFNGEAQAD